MYRGKPIIGIVGGIGSGKSYVARIFGEEGCLVVDSDAQIREAYVDPNILDTLRRWWGDGVFNADGTVNRPAIGKIIFSDPAQRERLEGLLHPWVDARRREQMAQAPAQVLAFVWDTPLLIEVGLDHLCDAVVLIDAPYAERLERVKRARGWDEADFLRREKLQLPLDRKREISHYQIVNAAGAANLRDQVRQILSRVVTRLSGSLEQG